MLSPRKSFFRMAALGAVALLVALALGGCGELDKEKRFYEREQEFLVETETSLFVEVRRNLLLWSEKPTDPELAVNHDFWGAQYDSYTFLEGEFLGGHRAFTKILLESIKQGERLSPAYYRAFGLYLEKVAIPNARLLAERAAWLARPWPDKAKPALMAADRLWREYIDHAEQTLAQLKKDQIKAEQNPPRAAKGIPQEKLSRLFAPAPFSFNEEENLEATIAQAMPSTYLAKLSATTELPALTPAYLKELKTFAKRSLTLHQAILVQQATLENRPFFQERYVLAQQLYDLNIQRLQYDIETQIILLEMFKEYPAQEKIIPTAICELLLTVLRNHPSNYDFVVPFSSLEGRYRSRLEYLPCNLMSVISDMVEKLYIYENVLQTNGNILRLSIKTVAP